MPVFLQEPRYRFGAFGFYTEPSFGRKILMVALGLSLIVCSVALVTAVHTNQFDDLIQAVFLIASAWLLVLGLMRLLCTAAMWVAERVFDWIADCTPSLTAMTHFASRVYWILVEIYVWLAFLALLIMALLNGLGVVSLGA